MVDIPNRERASAILRKVTLEISRFRMTPGQSLVRYDNPVLVSRTDVSTKTSKAAEKQSKVPKKLPPVDDKRPKTPSQTEDILNSILPPRFSPLIQGMGRKWAAMDSKSFEHSRNTSRCDKSTSIARLTSGTTRSHASETSSPRNRNLSCAKGIVLSMLR
jgi:hypothetical protein